MLFKEDWTVEEEGNAEILKYHMDMSTLYSLRFRCIAFLLNFSFSYGILLQLDYYFALHLFNFTKENSSAEVRNVSIIFHRVSVAQHFDGNDADAFYYLF